MNILIDIRLLGRGGVSGIEEYTKMLIEYLLKQDQKNHYQLFYNGLKTEPLPPNWRQFKNISITNWKIPNKFLDLGSKFLNLPKIDKLIKTDLVFSPHFNILAIEKASRIITFHDLSFLHHPDFFSWKQNLWHWLQSYRKQAEYASKIIAVSEFTKSDLIELLKIPEEKIEVVYSGINPKLKRLKTDDENLQKFQRRHQLDFPFLLFLGTIEPRKNVLAVIKTFNILKSDPQFKNFKLIIAGRPGWLYENVAKEAGESPYRDEIIFWGQVANDEKVFLYNLAEIFVYPSFFEGFGFPPLEAQACGCPTIAANRTSLPEILGDSALLISPWKIDDFVEAIKQIVSDGKLRQELVKSGLENAQKFDWQKTAKKTLRLFNLADSD